MKRNVVKIDESLCNGCGVCIPSCHEGALQIIDNKARLISDLMCDGLGACLSDCPQGAITIEHREAEPYDERKVMEIMIGKGKNTVIAHLKHLKEHDEKELLHEAVSFLKEKESELSFSVAEVVESVHSHRSKMNVNKQNFHPVSACPGAKERRFAPQNLSQGSESTNGSSALQQWPIQMHLINPTSQSFKESDLLIAADCVAFSLGNFHQKYLKGKSLVIACPKLDSRQNIYAEKITALIDVANINTITVMIMQVPCCGGLLQLTKTALQNAKRKVPVKLFIVGIEGDILKEEWI